MKNDSTDSLLVLRGRSGISFQTVFTHGIRSGTACKYVFIPFPSCAKRLHPAEIRLPLPLLWTQNPPRQAWSWKMCKSNRSKIAKISSQICSVQTLHNLHITKSTKRFIRLIPVSGIQGPRNVIVSGQQTKAGER